MAKLLLVEDDNNLREIYEARLSAEGYDITTAQNGEEALSVAKDVHPDLIISDVMMPRISGFEMLDILRNTDELKNTKIIMLTALGQAEDRGRADNLGADRYLVKSQVTLEDIVKAAEELLNGDAAPTTQVSNTPAEVEESSPEMTNESVVSTEPVLPVENVVTEAPASTAVPASDVQTDVSVQPPTTEPAVSSVVETTPMPSTPPAVQTVTDPAQAVTPQTIDPVASSAPVVSSPSSTPSATTITVPDPDPIVATPPVVAPPDPQPITVGTMNPTASPTQTLADEEAAIEQQIASFAEAPVASTPAPQIQVVPAADTAANDAVLAQAVSDLTDVNTPAAEQMPVTVSVEPVPGPSPEPETSPTPTPAPTPQPDMNTGIVTDSQQVNGRKTIQPLDETTAMGTPNLQELLAAEDAKEAVNSAPAPQTAAPSAEPQKPAIDPNTIAL